MSVCLHLCRSNASEKSLKKVYVETYGMCEHVDSHSPNYFSTLPSVKYHELRHSPIILMYAYSNLQSSIKEPLISTEKAFVGTNLRYVADTLSKDRTMMDLDTVRDRGIDGATVFCMYSNNNVLRRPHVSCKATQTLALFSKSERASKQTGPLSGLYLEVWCTHIWSRHRCA